MVTKIRRVQQHSIQPPSRSYNGPAGLAALSIDTVMAEFSVPELDRGEEASRALDPERAAVQPEVNLHREPGVLDRAVPIASTSELDVAADRAQRGAAAELERSGIRFIGRSRQAW